MRFMWKNEYLLLMNLGNHQLQGTPILTVDERRRIREAGIQTAIEYPEWADLEPAQGIYNFSSIENVLEMNRSADMKTIFSIFNPWIPQWIPNDWRPKYQSGVYNTAFISIWSDEGMKYKADFSSMLINRYDADDVMFIMGDVDTGESMLPSYAFYDDHAIKDFGGIPDFENGDTKKWLEDSVLKYYVDMQKLFYPQFREIWDAHQWLIAQLNPASMNYMQPRLLQAYRDTFGDMMDLVLLQYTYFDSSHPAANEVYVDMLKNTYNCEVIVEAMFCNGFPMTAPRSISKGFRGQIICPVHPHTHKQRFEGWMVESIGNANRLWMESRG
jgi:hypothetical protein